MFNQNSTFTLDSNPVEDKESALKDIKWKLNNVIQVIISYTAFVIMFIITMRINSLLCFSFMPLFIYRIIRIILCGRNIYKGNDIDLQENLKEIIESALMILYFV